MLVVGGGGREHALAWRLRQSPKAGDVYVAPGNAGSKADGLDDGSALDTGDFDAVTAFCEANTIGLVVVGPEAPLVAGIADHLRERGVRVFGPSAAAAQLEGSKAFMKDVCAQMNIPTYHFHKQSDADELPMILDYTFMCNKPVAILTDANFWGGYGDQ